MTEFRLIGVGTFTMHLDEGRLPVDVDVSRNLHNRLDPPDFSAAAMTAYYQALWRHDAPIIAQGKFAALSASPSRRAQLITLLDTQSLAEFEAVERALRGGDEFIGHGPPTDFGSRSVTVAASLSRISSISIDPAWAATASPPYIAHDIIDCANQIRHQRPHFHEGGSWAHRSDDELEYELGEYENYLTRTS
ncbi:hypothetical protein OHA40_25730 [Nocardia sp. NBC_00508]|uniref:hypothetical protein n=1 Tax=Nocardia sp. NBC_00508 TaxID=2975992 RepID=UPI002E81329C|nr:hypothetical protein [Nocardia sp. NBC_00508]WUD65035.1 hypothetical protein OHA40_25730 [Nocardia sp. NBC_00508]